MKIRHFLNFLTIVTGAVAVTLTSLWIGKQSYSWLPPQGAAESHLIDDLFSFLVTLGSLIFLGVTATLFYSICFHRAKATDLGDGPHIEGNITLEVVWTAIPIMLVLWIAGYSYQVYEQMGIQGPSHQIHLHNPMKMKSASATIDKPPVAVFENIEHIDVSAKQWAWVFHYPESNVTSTELHLPQNSRVRLNLHSEDVLHGFYIPAFRLKQDIIPGNDLDFEFTPIRPGAYDLTDSQYSGTYFATMRAKVIVESLSQYQQWLSKAASQELTPATNQAASEYAQKLENGINSGWKTVEPATPPLVNFPG
ncbi:cytochrome c oxidase subunit II [Aphanizomenon flos-aquae NRERC-008]|jgi:cytochrome c oxidase subunit 2|uniref:Cytochrome c oxidase subunit 2 n=1 Tax=Aphanizomenon flos-aquae FACHB-1249 TaxID=2692889 RepID=A0ABR8IMY0_APHFL|nr:MULTISPECIES: cytochrome c oxidase subunit II [Aphanizomenon]MBD2389062.1 cytochrome c oxidase subunit II [Aphanizomenon flos-aquae FACHB-1171]MBD2556719.1 cytochrome c oxidase subunit II [Aphanizomenon flos-aquae FACHB-1290]MBD2630075.1 cytochrome c oxidase subunit II [Aphanizomenon sp. FACHB-1399]MBD2643079.1 cytochrome c oxidase subunit II [Aphanizomenon sp. FACHB-1401]MBD2655776.1 cytochrome c oxidase subunit II [Aphanizomenon flos-aquae FACHB-1265]